MVDRYSAAFADIRTTDVLVIGGGPGGIGAALAAARNGADVTLVEQYGVLGGMSSVGLVGPIMTSYSADGTVQRIRGVFDELVRQGAYLGPRYAHLEAELAVAR